MHLNNPSMGAGSLSVIMPAYNEEGNIVQAIEECLEHLPHWGHRFEVVIVDDCSTDRTRQLAQEMADRNAAVRLVSNERNMGLGGSLRKGFAVTAGEYVFYTDSDLPIYMNDLLKALPLMEKYDFVAGCRLNRDEGPLRFIYSRLYNALVRALFSIPIRDVNFSFKLMKRRVLAAVDLRSDGSFIDVELLAETQRHGFTMTDIGVRYRSRVWGESTLASLSVIRGILVELYEYKWGRMKRA